MQLLDLREGARELKLSIHTMRALVSQKRIPYVRLGRRVLLRREDLERLVTDNLVESRGNGRG